MRRTLILIFVFSSFMYYSQSALFSDLKSKLKTEFPELKTDNKLIILNVWSSNDQKSREANMQLNKAYTAYEWARLKGGLKGMIGITICVDDDQSMEKIVLQKDKVSKLIVVKKDKLQLGEIRNIIFDSEGNVLTKNVSRDIFEEVHQLLTR